MPDARFNNGKEQFLSGAINLVSDTIKVALFPSTFSANIDTQEWFSNISGSQVSSSGTGYTAGGLALAGKTVTQNNTTDKGVFDANDLTFSSVTLTGANAVRYAVLYKDTGTPSTSPLIAQFDFGSDQAPNGVDFTIVWNAAGILDLS